MMDSEIFHLISLIAATITLLAILRKLNKDEPKQEIVLNVADDDPYVCPLMEWFKRDAERIAEEVNMPRLIGSGKSNVLQSRSIYFKDAVNGAYFRDDVEKSREELIRRIKRSMVGTVQVEWTQNIIETERQMPSKVIGRWVAKCDGIPRETDFLGITMCPYCNTGPHYKGCPNCGCPSDHQPRAHPAASWLS